jgi:hypothetical protein
METSHMVRSRWVKAVMATVVSTGLAWGQSGVPSPSQAPDDPTGRVITVNEAGKPPQKCRVVKVSTDEKGRKVLQVESLTTGEVMTIITEGAPVMGEAPGKPRTLRTQIFHWGRDHTPPAVICDSGCPTCTPSNPGWGAPAVANCDTCKPSTGDWGAPAKTVTVLAETKVVTTTPKPVETKLPEVVTTPPPKPAEKKVAQAEPSLLDKWRESWGKSDKPKAPAVETTKAPEPKKPAIELTKASEPTKPVPPADLPHVDTKKADPLLSDPTLFSKRPVDQKLPPKAAVPPTDLAKLPGTGESLGAGSRSITDSGSVTQAPSPVATWPAANLGVPPRAPQPTWRVPQAPQPVNPGSGYATEANQGGIAYNAFTPYEFTPPAPGTPGQSMLGNAFSNDYDPRPVSGVFGPSGPPPMMGPAGCGPANAMLPPAPYGPVVRMPTPPTPPNPMGQGTQLAMLPPQRGTGVVQTGYQAPAAPAAPTAAGMTPQQLNGMLRDALYPSQREWAAEKLSALDCKQNEAAVQTLTQVLHDDPAPSVRAACIRSLARMKADSYAVVSAIQSAKKDADARVCNEAEEALAVLAPATTPPAPLLPKVQPVGVVPPAPPVAPPTGSPALPPLSN